MVEAKQMMADPFEFIVRESKVSSSQEDILQRIPGWDEREDPVLSPSQADLPLSRLCGASSTENEGSGSEKELGFGLQGPLELASPDTQACQEDSYNAAFESDRERSLSPRAGCSMFSAIWGSRLITQSQDAVGDIDLLVPIGTRELHSILRNCKEVESLHEADHAEEHSKKHRDSLHHKGKEHCQAKMSEPGGFGKSGGCLKDIVVPQDLLCVAEHRKGNSAANFLHGCNTADTKRSVSKQACHMLESAALNAQSGQSTLLSSKGLEGNGLEDSLAKDDMLKLRSSAATEGLTIAMNAEKSNGDNGKGTEADLLQALKPLRDDNHLHRENNQLIGPGDVTTKDPQRSQSNCSVRTRTSKRVLPAVMSNKDRTPMKRIEVEINDLTKPKHADHGFFPESVMDVVMSVSGILPTPSLDEPDLLSVVMGTGVSLSLPLRNCRGDLIPTQDQSMLK